MKYINFEKVIIKNFLSVGDEEVEVSFKSGINIITGVNKDKQDRRNGVGKSTIADAIYFAIFGNTLRELKKEHITNNITQKTCEVRLFFHVRENEKVVRYQIYRLLNPTKCYLYIDDEDKTRDTIVNTTEYINNIINSSSDIFQNCIIMTVNNTIPFMAKKKLDKRKFIENIFNLQVFSGMLSNLRTEYSEVMRLFDSECVRYEEISTAIQSYKTQQQNNLQQQQEQVSRLKARKIDNINETKQLDEQINSLSINPAEDENTTISLLEENRLKCSNKIEELTTELSEYRVRHETLQAKADDIDANHDVCPACLRKITESDKKEIDAKKSKIICDASKFSKIANKTRERIDKAKNIKKQIISQITHHKNILQENDLKRKDLQNIQQRIKQINEWNNQIDEDIKQLSDQQIGSDKIINENVSRLETVQNSIDELKTQISDLDVIKFIVSEEGVKSYIVKKILQLFNSKLSYYLKKMDANCICVFDEYFEEQIIDEKGKLCSYFNFSGAERKNIDLACLFAFMDIRRLQGDVAFNFSIYDELLDSSLDEKGIELVINILQDRVEKYNECIMIISHRKESSKHASGEVILLEKSNGITTRKNIE